MSRQENQRDNKGYNKKWDTSAKLALILDEDNQNKNNRSMYRSNIGKK